jgi:nucleotide-binding universal stress UspA family protein
MIEQNVVCGVDASPEGTVAATVAARVAAPEGSLTLVTVEDTTSVARAGYVTPSVMEVVDEEAHRAVAAGVAATAPLHEAETRLLTGSPIAGLLEEIKARNASLVVVGSHGHSRPVGIALGSVATFMLHEAPCSVLVARDVGGVETWPRTVVAGVDGSSESAAALAEAKELAGRFGAHLRVVVATADRHADVAAARELEPEIEERDGNAVDVLSVLSEHADLVVVGSRGLRGVRALGSVSERVAHEARSSVLVVRGPAPPDE